LELLPIRNFNLIKYKNHVNQLITLVLNSVIEDTAIDQTKKEAIVARLNEVIELLNSTSANSKQITQEEYQMLENKVQGAISDYTKNIDDAIASNQQQLQVIRGIQSQIDALKAQSATI